MPDTGNELCTTVEAEATITDKKNN